MTIVYALARVRASERPSASASRASAKHANENQKFPRGDRSQSHEQLSVLPTSSNKRSSDHLQGVSKQGREIRIFFISFRGFSFPISHISISNDISLDYLRIFSIFFGKILFSVILCIVFVFRVFPFLSVIFRVIFLCIILEY